MSIRPKEEQILKTAEQLFVDGGFHATGINRVIKESGVATMTLYRYFPSKNDLVVGVLKYREEKYFNCLRLPEKKTVQSVVDAHCQWIAEQNAKGCLFFRALEEYAEIEKKVAQFVKDHKKKVLDYIESTAQEEGLYKQHSIATKIALVLEGATAMAEAFTPDEIILHTKELSSLILNDVGD
ncbi:TetR/AcrR family transcriptional regulator [Virgibacillus oceani]|uniref:TetR family transcriptional regulator n=1 Tax=Virgibacillus oceani TaxID=1479511 RepID=A0A917M755_9BACI|nr:TetR/AcrR family transcriptional regulator [Virgibacillus oceani]GGG79187.1 TetR family transcriptional regulator [Virgibacillus oceani]